MNDVRMRDNARQTMIKTFGDASVFNVAHHLTQTAVGQKIQDMVRNHEDSLANEWHTDNTFGEKALSAVKWTGDTVFNTTPGLLPLPQAIAAKFVWDRSFNAANRFLHEHNNHS